MPDYRRKLQDLLIELFQFNDSADLDFGIYAIMNRKAAEITAFIERDLLEAVASGLQLITDAQRDQAEAAYRDAKAALEAEVGNEFLALDPAGHLTEEALAARGGTMRRLREAYQNAKADVDAARQSADLEARVYNDLYRFFARYYDDGDFISQRRYGAAEKYAIPYNGEEVTLYWANYDQYYVKSGETFTDYRFQLAEGVGFAPATVAFKLRAASVAQNNVKGDKRFFIVGREAPIAWDPAARVLTVGFEYRPLTDDEKKLAGAQKQQERLNADAEKTILAAAPDALIAERLATLEGPKGQERTALARHLARYTARNTRDYFIHKNLQRFLERELDFFLKSEVLRLEDLDWTRPGVVRTAAARVETIRLIAGRIIAFLAQIEEFQKRLWEKRKFVVQSDWCVTLDRVPEALYEEIAANERQVAEWVRLYALQEGEQAGFFGADGPAGAVEFLRQHQTMMVDTAFFGEDFKGRLLAGLSPASLEASSLLIRSENYQALNLLAPRYAKGVKSIYIDPPYNTDAGPILYKNDYRSSSWLSLMADRLRICRSILAADGVLCATIDDYEQKGLAYLLAQEFGDENVAGTVTIRNNPSGRPVPSGFAQAHEYAIFVTNSGQAVLGSLPRTQEQAARYRHADADGQFMWELFRKRGSNSERRNRPSLYYPLYVHGEQVRVPRMNWSEDLRTWLVTEEPLAGEVVVFPIDENGVERTWRREPSKVSTSPTSYRARQENGWITVYYKFRPRSEGVLPLTVWADAKYSATEHGTGLLKHYFTEYDVFSYPKSLYAVMDCLRIGGLGDTSGVVLDFFAGSGTTAHAALALNAIDGEDRSYVLVEMGDHFDSVLKPRIQKVIYAADWRDGKPVAGSLGQSHMFQYIRLESYEDALNNIRFQDFGQKEPGLLDTLHAMPDYVLHYMLDYETAGSPSLLDLARFDHPFYYRLNITRGDITAAHPVDLVTTFNFLLGLRVRTYRRLSRDGHPIVRVIGEDPRGRRVCVLWRDVPPIEDMDVERAWLEQHALEGVAPDLLYVNGECALPNAVPIEPEFQRLMFEPVTGTGG